MTTACVPESVKCLDGVDYEVVKVSNIVFKILFNFLFVQFFYTTARYIGIFFLSDNS